MIVQKLIDIQRNFRAKLSFFYNEKQLEEKEDNILIKQLILKSKKISYKNKKNYKKTHKIFSQKVLDLVQKKINKLFAFSFIQKMFLIHNRLFLLNYLNELKHSNNCYFEKLIKEEKVGNPVRYFISRKQWQ